MKSATGLTGSGSRDWFIQRVSAVVLAVYTVVVFGWVLCNGGFNYEQWYGFMMTLPMKIFSLLAVLSLVAHAWIGMWQVLTDYVKHVATRLLLQLVIVVALVAYVIYGFVVVWGV